MHLTNFNIRGLDEYRRYYGAVSMDVTDKDHLGYYRDTTYKTIRAFFKVLQKGNNLALYSYTDGLKTRFFIGEAPGYLPKELVYRLYYIQVGLLSMKEDISLCLPKPPGLV